MRLSDKNFRTALKEARELNEELKEIVGEKAESTQEYASLISSQRQEIENLRKVISENNLEVIFKKTIFSYKDCIFT